MRVISIDKNTHYLQKHSFPFYSLVRFTNCFDRLILSLFSVSIGLLFANFAKSALWSNSFRLINCWLSVLFFKESIISSVVSSNALILNLFSRYLLIISDNKEWYSLRFPFCQILAFSNLINSSNAIISAAIVTSFIIGRSSFLFLDKYFFRKYKRRNRSKKPDSHGQISFQPIGSSRGPFISFSVSLLFISNVKTFIKIPWVLLWEENWIGLI